MIETTGQHQQGNLQNSAVLKMLEEEEGERIYTGYKRVAWPPVSGSNTPVKGSTPQPQQTSPQHQGGRNYYSQPSPTQYPQQFSGQSPQPQPQQYQQPAQYYQQQHQSRQQSSTYQSSKSSYQQQQQSTYYKPSAPEQPPYQKQETYSDHTSTQETSSYPSYQSYQSPAPHPTRYPSTTSFSGGVPQKPSVIIQPQSQEAHKSAFHSPSQVYPTSPSQEIGNPPRGWSHVPSPTPTRTGYIQGAPQYPSGGSQPPYGSEPHFGSTQYQPQSEQQHHQTPVSHQAYGQQPYQQQQYQQQPYQQQQYQQQPYQQQQQQYYPQGQQQQFDRGQSPGIITLRKEPPVTQKPAPVYTSQPAAASFRGGSNMRGDLKWPPPDVRAQMAAEEEQRRELARGPAFRPRRVHKDYTPFFAKHALNATYPGYKIPPGTQHVYVQF